MKETEYNDYGFDAVWEELQAKTEYNDSGFNAAWEELQAPSKASSSDDGTVNQSWCK